MKNLLFGLVAFVSISANASTVTCILSADGPDYSSENTFEYLIDDENYKYDEQEVNEYIYSAVTIEVDGNSVDVNLALTDENDYVADDSLSLDLGKDSLIEGYYYLEDEEYEYSFLCSFEK